MRPVTVMAGHLVVLSGPIPVERIFVAAPLAQNSYAPLAWANCGRA
jgi:hypothetical protein